MKYYLSPRTGLWFTPSVDRDYTLTELQAMRDAGQDIIFIY